MAIDHMRVDFVKGSHSIASYPRDTTVQHNEYTHTQLHNRDSSTS